LSLTYGISPGGYNFRQVDIISDRNPEKCPKEKNKPRC
jgi:hypothetical protein